ncbi:SusD/RagB family nutrient-binding outer membrane lipoprotein [Flavivirga sp. 57AJ16]|uniref:SusD/RagB family nutrient-binding outer membrane lipoprotein n=1 Tax=Flavivirga sp. 57AJ16 TaxID=3025307 RepID=UPI0023662EA0|nr:SusD/RagB family nutrient-binding outer membrane lipoprotein [Flavivirga sp. 57AJ16]MDD7886294.1 SusD/RagB family nutrient-binding outer membrane lipoprotein [Flavivirga sp. 57AJ16]
MKALSQIFVANTNEGKATSYKKTHNKYLLMKSFILLSLILILTQSCSKLVEDLNNDPNNQTQSAYQNILTGAEVGNMLFQTGENARRASIFAGQYTGIDRQHLGFSQYSVTTSDFDGLWNDGFNDALRNAIVAEQTAQDDNAGAITIGITQVLQAQTFGTLASLYGDIPYDEAVNVEIQNPMFENQSQVYSKVQTLLDSAISNLQQGSGRPATGSDIYFDGNAQAWIECAYTLKARFYMHIKDYGSAYAAAQNGISSLNNSMLGPHGTAAEDSNLNYQFFAIEVRQSDLVVSDFMAGLTDPASSTYRGNSKTNELGRHHFYFTTNALGVQPNITNGYAAQSASADLVTYQENLLILAEAGFRTNGFNNGLSHLNNFRAFMASGGYLTNANTSDILYDAYIGADFASGGIENPDSISADNALLREILQERYVTLFGQIEVFNDTRRTESESIVRVPITPNTGSTLPQRFIYPQSEIDRNSNIPNPIPDFFEKTPINQ